MIIKVKEFFSSFHSKQKGCRYGSLYFYKASCIDLVLIVIFLKKVGLLIYMFIVTSDFFCAFINEKDNKADEAIKTAPKI
jgi:hypothetical protein